MEITILGKIFLTGSLSCFIGVIGTWISPCSNKTPISVQFILFLLAVGGLLTMVITMFIGIWRM